MAGRQAALGVVLGAILVACGAGAEPTQSDLVGGTTPGATSAPAAVTPSPVTDLDTPGPTPAVTPKPTPKPIPVPPKPTGLELSLACGWGGDGGGGCDLGTDGASHLSWKKPRTKGVELRVYGVTTCFRTDASDGPCLREHTAVPEDIRVLLAKGPASRGGLSFFQTLDRVETEEGCTYGYLSGNGTTFYSIVVAAYNASGHSIFAIADDGHYDSEECDAEAE